MDDPEGQMIRLLSVLALREKVYVYSGVGTYESGGSVPDCRNMQYT
jgi:hypothetical protein